MTDKLKSSRESSESKDPLANFIGSLSEAYKLTKPPPTSAHWQQEIMKEARVLAASRNCRDSEAEYMDGGIFLRFSAASIIVAFMTFFISPDFQQSTSDQDNLTTLEVIAKLDPFDYAGVFNE